MCAAASMDWSCYWRGTGGLCWCIGVCDRMMDRGGRGVMESGTLADFIPGHYFSSFFSLTSPT